MKKLALSFLLAFPLASGAAQNPLARNGVTIETLAGQSCAIQIRYDSSKPNLGELAYIGSGCDSTVVQAIDAARTATSKALPVVPGEPAIPHIYECSTLVMWNTLAPTKPTITTTGGDSCMSSRGISIYYASFAVDCFFLKSGRCVP